MLPADERLDPHVATLGQVHDRLIDEAELVELDGALELDAQRIALAQGDVHAGVEDREPALAIGLGHVHRDIRVADEVRRAVDGVTGTRDPDARGDDDGAVGDQVRRP